MLVPLRPLGIPLSKHAVEIINPLPGGMRYTCKPEHFVSIGVAQMQGGKLMFHDKHQERFTPRTKYFWNGSQGALKMHKPGEVRS
jgi:hypothetical protein